MPAGSGGRAPADYLAFQLGWAVELCSLPSHLPAVAAQLAALAEAVPKLLSLLRFKAAGGFDAFACKRTCQLWVTLQQILNPLVQQAVHCQAQPPPPTEATSCLQQWSEAGAALLSVIPHLADAEGFLQRQPAAQRQAAEASLPEGGPAELAKKTCRGIEKFAAACV